MCLRIAQSVQQGLRDRPYVTKLQYVLTIRRAGDLCQLAQLRSFAVSDAVDGRADGLECLSGGQSSTRVDVRVTVSYQDYHLQVPTALRSRVSCSRSIQNDK